MFNLSCELKDQEKKIRQEVEEKADEIIRELNQEAEHLNGKLNRFKMICCYCGVRMSAAVVNEQCESNSKKE